MKDTGVIRKIDPLGRLVIPKEIRKELAMDVNEKVHFFIDGDKVFIKKYESACIFCGSEKDVMNFMDRNLCFECAKKIKKDI